MHLNEFCGILEEHLNEAGEYYSEAEEQVVRGRGRSRYLAIVSPHLVIARLFSSRGVFPSL